MEYNKGTTIHDSVMQEYEDFGRMRELHTRSFRQFNSAYDGKMRSLTDYIDYSFAKFNQYVEIPEDSEDYEVHLALPNVRNKMMAILARLSAQRMKAEIHPQNVRQKTDKILSKFLSDFLDWSDTASNQDKSMFYWMLETAMKGTGILCEDYYKSVKEIKDVRVYDPLTGKSQWTKKKIVDDGCYSFVVPLEEFYVWDIREQEIKKQKKVAWATIMDFKEFQWQYREFPKVNDVIPGSGLIQSEKAFYNEFLGHLTGESVEVLRIYDQYEDLFKIIANGVELTEEDNPIPFKHKRAPFVEARYEPIQNDFFYGKSLADKMGNLSDAIDQLFADLFNRNQLTMKAPLVAREGSILQDTVWRPDSILTYTGEKPEVLQVSANSQDTDRLLNVLYDQLNLSSVSPVGQGQAGSGSTAREVILAQENANELMSMFLRFMEWGEKGRVELRISNLLQFFFLQPKIDEITDAAKKVGAFRVLFQHGIKTAEGKLGIREIRLKPDAQIIRPEVLEKKEGSKEREIIEVSPEFVQDLKYFIKIIPNSSIKISQALKKALKLEYTTTMSQLFPDMVNRRELATSITEEYEEDAETMLIEGEETPDMKFERMMRGSEGKERGEMTNKLLQPEKELATLALT